MVAPRADVVISHTNLALKWDEKPEDLAILLRNHVPLIVERTDDERNVRTSSKGQTHTLIKGDNLHALVALLPKYKGRVSVIQTDPPHNTDNGFIYNQKRSSSNNNPHSSWLSFMERRLKVSHELLKPEGVIAITVDTYEQAHLKILMDSIFGEQNFISMLVSKGVRKNDATFISDTNEYTLVYTKNLKALRKQGAWFEFKEGASELIEAGEKAWEESNGDAKEATKLLRAWKRNLPDEHPVKTSEALKKYTHVDDAKPGKIYYPDNITSPSPRPNMMYDYTASNGVTYVSPEKGWRFKKEAMAKKDREGTLYFSATGRLANKKYLHETLHEKPESIFEDPRNRGTKMLQDILGNTAFKFPKNHETIKRWISIMTTNDKEAIVLDFFAGSGSTLHAVAELNARDGGNREAILISDSGIAPSDKNPVDIVDEITVPRIRKVLTGKNWHDRKSHTPLKQNMEFAEIELVPSTAQNIIDYSDTGEPVYARNEDGQIIVLQITDYDLIARLVAQYRIEDTYARALIESWKRWRDQ